MSSSSSFLELGSSNRRKKNCTCVQGAYSMNNTISTQKICAQNESRDEKRKGKKKNSQVTIHVSQHKTYKHGIQHCVNKNAMCQKA